MKKICVINAYGDKNIGDAAILKVALDFISEAYKENCTISVFCDDSNSLASFISNNKNISIYQPPYGYAIRGSKKASAITKILRFISIYVVSIHTVFINKILKISLPNKNFYSYINEIKKSDVIVNMGGGYLTTNNNTDYFGLLLTLLPIYIAKVYKKKILFLPMTVGPFANVHHKNLSYGVMKNTTVLARDQITLNLIEQSGISNKINAFFAPDLALFLEDKIKTPMKKKYIVLTARDWFNDKQKQDRYEKSLVDLINHAWSKYKLRTIFIPMARNEIEDNDNNVAKRLSKRIRKKGIFSVFQPTSISDVRAKLGGAMISVCTRMHSAILSATVKTPFIAIGYGHKTLGLVKNIGIENWHIDIKDVNKEALIEMFDTLRKEQSYKQFIKTVDSYLKKNKRYKHKIIQELRYQIA